MAETTIINVERVRRRRAELGLSVRVLASHLGIVATSYAAIENGRA